MVIATATVYFQDSTNDQTYTVTCSTMLTAMQKLQATLDKESEFWFGQWYQVAITITR